MHVIGNKVYAIIPKISFKHKKKDKCTFCKGYPKVKKDGILYVCSKCNGDGYNISKPERLITWVPEFASKKPIKMTVVGSSFEQYKSRNTGEVKKRIRYLLRGIEHQIIVTKDCNVFLSLEDALAECEKRGEGTENFFMEKGYYESHHIFEDHEESYLIQNPSITI